MRKNNSMFNMTKLINQIKLLKYTLKMDFIKRCTIEEGCTAIKKKKE